MKELLSLEKYPVENTDDTINISLRITELCNHDCSYCGWHDNTVPNASYDALIQLFKTIKEVIKKEQYGFYFTGGEPTIYPRFKELLEEVFEIFEGKCSFHIQTNGIKGIEWYKDFARRKYAGHSLFSVSHQASEIWKRSNYNKWIESVNVIDQAGMLDIVDLMLEHEEIDTINWAFKKWEIDKVSWFSKIQPNFIDYKNNLRGKYMYIILRCNSVHEKYICRYSDGTEVIKTQTDLVNDNELDFRFYECETGLKNIVLEVDGTVSLCLAQIKNPIIKQYNIFKEPHKVRELTTRKHVCVWEECICELWLKREKI